MTRRARKRGPFYFYLTDQVDSVKVVLDMTRNRVRIDAETFGRGWP